MWRLHHFFVSPFRGGYGRKAEGDFFNSQYIDFPHRLSYYNENSIGKTSMNNPHERDPGPNVLVVDDEENICDILREFLESEGYSVETAGRAEEGLELFRAHPAPVVITDLNMPGMSGWEMARIIREEAPDSVIVLLSGWGSEVEEYNRKEHLVDKILHKPINFSTLLDYIKSIDPSGK